MGRPRIPAALIVLAALAGCAPDADGPVRAGAPFPVLDLWTLDGDPHRLRAGDGRVLVVNLWAPWCGPCVREMPALHALARRLDPGRFAVVGVTVDDEPFLVDEFLRNQAIGFPNYVDRGRRLVESVLAVEAFPQTLVVAPDGRLARRVVGWYPWDRPEALAYLEAVASSGVDADPRLLEIR
jgi:thiol-disulfide isomerase/thioredoxin